MTKNKIFFVTVLFLGAFHYYTLAQSVLKTMKRLPDTGQTASYTNTPGEDSDYNINPPYFINNGNGTITDTVTGLMWQQVDGGEVTFDKAVIYANDLVLGGYSDWRMPSVLELNSLLNHDKNNPALNTTFFTATAAQYWWSGQKQVNDANKAWCANAGGGIGNHPINETVSAGGTKKFHVRAVRDISTPTTIPNRFVDNKNGTTTDQLTGLIWQQIPTDSMTWEQALITAENLVSGGSSQWRMPNIKELQSISEVSIYNPSISKTYFNGISTAWYWSSTSLANQSTKAWYLDTQFGITTQALKTNKLRLLAVRSATTVTSMSTLSKAKESLSIYPNPGTGSFTLKADEPLGEIRIINQLGQTIMKTNTNEKVITLFLTEKGIFQIICRHNQMIITKSIVNF
ncbi:MAG: hypothetical protein RLZZ417_1508 [Bacteroidota bacterium]